MRYFLATFWKPIVIALIICYGSLTTSSNLNKVHFLNYEHIDKAIHFLMYAGLSLFLFRPFSKKNTTLGKDRILLSLIITISYGLIMEVFQYSLTSSRSAEFLDVLANTLGSIFGIILFWFANKLKLTKYL